MHIEGLFIENFGKIKNFRIRFNDGMNVIFGENESGKSTVQTFIKSILYDLDRSNSGSNGLSEFMKYKPWEGETYGGYIELRTDEGKYIKITKDFNEGTFQAYDDLNKEITDYFSDGTGFLLPGEKLLGISKIFFEKTAFIRQRGTKISHDNNDDLASKLDNFLKTGFMDVSYEYASKALNNSLVNCVGNDGYSSGILSDINSRLQNLEAKKNEDKKSNEEITKIEESLNELKKIKGIDQNKKYILQGIKDCVNINDSIHIQQNKIEQLENLLSDIAEKENAYNSNKGKTTEYEKIAERLRQSSIPDEFNGDIYEKYRQYLNSTEEKRELSSIIQEKTNQIKDLEDPIQAQDNIQFIEKEESYTSIKNIYEKLGELKQEQEKVDENNYIINEKKRKRTFIFTLVVFMGVFILAIALAVVLFATNLKTYLTGNYIQYMFYGLYSLGGLSCIFLIGTIISNVKYIKVKALRTKSEDIAFQTEYNINEYTNNLNKLLRTAKVRDLSEFLSVKEAYIESTAKIEKHKKELESKRSEYEDCASKELTLSNYLAQKLISFDIIKNAQQPITENDIFKYKQILEKHDDTKNEKYNLSFDLEKDESIILSLKKKVAALAEIDKFAIEKVKKALEGMRDSINNMDPLLINSQNKLRVVLSNYDGKNYQDLKKLSERVFDNERINLVYVEQKNSEILENEINVLHEIKENESKLSKLSFKEKESKKRNEEINSLIRKREFTEESIQALNISLKVLEESSKEVRKSFTPFINTKMQKIIQAITNGTHKGIVTDEALDISFVENVNSNIVTENLDYLSDGTIDQVYIAMRIAMSDFLSADTENIPFIIDEAFSQYDDNRIYNTLLFLNGNSENRQLMFFSCKKRELDIAREIFQGNLNIIYL